MRGILNTLSEYLDRENLAKVKALNNKHVEEEIEKFLKLCKPAKVTVITDDQRDIDYVRQLALDNKEELPLRMKGHTIHYDGYNDQGRDKENTKVLVTPEMKMSKEINTSKRF